MKTYKVTYRWNGKIDNAFVDAKSPVGASFKITHRFPGAKVLTVHEVKAKTQAPIIWMTKL